MTNYQLKYTAGSGGITNLQLQLNDLSICGRSRVGVLKAEDRQRWLRESQVKFEREAITNTLAELNKDVDWSLYSNNKDFLYIPSYYKTDGNGNIFLSDAVSEDKRWFWEIPADVCGTGGGEVNGFVISPGATIAGFGGSFYFGMSRKDGFGSGGLDISQWSLGVSIQAASGDFTWEGFSREGTNTSIGYGSYVESWSDLNPDKSTSPWLLRGANFGISTSQFKATRLKDLNLSGTGSFTIPIVK